MKKIVFLLLLMVASATVAFSQANGNGNGNNSGNWPPTLGEASTACGTTNSLLPVPNGGGSGPVIEPNGGWPMNKVVAILREARPAFPNTNLGQMIQAYNACSCVITYLGDGYFKVQIGGGTTVILIDGSF